jgi:peptide/nickel transport system permease protein
MDSHFVWFLSRRAVNAVVTVILMVAIIFAIIHLVAPRPVDLARLYVGPHFNQAELVQIAHRYGFDQPIYNQFVNYVIGFFQGNLGIDSIYNIPEILVIQRYFPITLDMVVLGTILGVVLGIFTGAIAASNRNSKTDYGIKALYLGTWAAPPFLVGVFLQLVLAYYLNLLPVAGVADPVLSFPPAVTGLPLIDSTLALDWHFLYSYMQHLVLPAFTIALISFGGITRLTRATMVDALDKDYVKLAYMKGLGKRKVVWGTAFRNAIIPIITLLAITFAYSVGGAVIVEDIFSYHGIGFFAVQASYVLDYPAILAITIITGVAVIIANFIADVLYGVMDPRVRLT